MRLTTRDYRAIHHDYTEHLRIFNGFSGLLRTRAEEFGLQPATRRALNAFHGTAGKISEPVGRLFECSGVGQMEFPKTQEEEVHTQRQMARHFSRLSDLVKPLTRKADAVRAACLEEAERLENKDAAESLRTFATHLHDSSHAFARIARSISGRWEKVALSDLLHSATTKLPLRVSVVCPPNEIQVYGGLELIRRIFLNLARNAKTHGNAENLRITAERQKDFVQLLFQDDGQGMGAGVDRSKIFDEFYTDGKGTGIGLNFSRRVAEEHGGTLDLVESNPGKTVFRLRLPVYGTKAHMKSVLVRGLKALKGLFVR